ncbi:MAG TPA: ABC transporter substrate-binding protein [Chloroflexota bacterium]|nr:ABC transporter substrate-binding protein [Chloroflexota bacterium]
MSGGIDFSRAPRPALWLVIGLVVGSAAGAALWLGAPRRSPPDLSLQRVKEAGVLVIGIDPSYPPFEVDNNGRLAGYDIDIAREVGRRLGVQVRFVTVDFGSLFDGLEVRKYDAAIGGVSPYPEYAKVLDYSVPYFDDGLVLVEKPSVPMRTLGVESGSDADLNADALRARLPGFSFQQFETQDDVRAALGRGTIRGAIVDAATAIQWTSTMSDLVVHPERLTSVPFVIAVRRSDQALLKALDGAIRAMEADGSTANLARVWLR